MADKKKTGIDIGEQQYVENREAVPVPLGKGGEMLTLYAYELGYLEMADVGIRAKNAGISWLSALVASSVQDEDGNKFTDEQAARLVKSVADPLFAAVIRVNKMDAIDKDGSAKN